MKVRNSDGLDLKDKSLPPFGLASFHLPSEVKALILVEGPYDWLRTYQHLYDLGLDKEFAIVALLGVSQWEPFLRKFELRLASQMSGRAMLLYFDNDKSGKDLTTRAIKDLTAGMWLPKSAVKRIPYKAHDPGDNEKEQLRNGLKQIGML